MKTRTFQKWLKKKLFSQSWIQSVKLRSGFSLIEVTVALAILGLSFSVLVEIQGRSTMLAGQANLLSQATQLSRLKLQDCKKEALKKIRSVGDFDAEGDFSEQGISNYTWECHAPRFTAVLPDMETVTSKLTPQSKEGQGKGKPQAPAANAGMMSPVVKMVGEALGDSLRELTVIVRWKDGTRDDEMRVVTHVIDPSAMAALARTMSQSAGALDGQKPKEEGEEPKANPGPPDQRRPPFP